MTENGYGYYLHRRRKCISRKDVAECFRKEMARQTSPSSMRRRRAPIVMAPWPRAAASAAGSGSREPSMAVTRQRYCSATPEVLTSGKECERTWNIIVGLNWIACNLDMGLLNATRDWEYDTAASSDACAIPRACAAMPMRPPSRVCMAILKPIPGAPSSIPSQV